MAVILPPMNEFLFRLVNHHAKNAWFDRLMPALSDKDYVVIPGVAVLLAGLFLGSRRTRTLLVALILAVLVADIGSERIIKNLVGAKRPYAVLEGVHAHKSGRWIDYQPEWYEAFERRKSHSFPSSHAANVAAVAVVLAFLSRRSLWGTIPLVALVGYSRVYTGNHFPLDVLGGYLWGGGCGLAMARWCPRIADRIWGKEPEDAFRPPWSAERKAFLTLLAAWTFANFLFVHYSAFTLAGDEAQYWDWSRQLAPGYYSKPPMIAYLMALLVGAGGNKEWAIRSGAVLLNAGTLALIYALTLRIAKRERAALVAVLVTIAMPFSWAGSILLTPDAPLALCWILAMFAFHRAIRGNSSSWWLVGLAFGLGMLTKYTMALLGVSFAAYLLLMERAWLRTKGPYLAMAVALVCMSGVLYWNWANDWISVRHTANIGAQEEATFGGALGQVASFLGGQVGVVSPVLFVFLVGAVVACARRWRDQKDAVFLLLCSGGLFAFYVAVSFVREPQPNWPVCAYLGAVVALGWLWTERGRSRAMRLTLGAGVLLGCFVGMAARSTDVLYGISAAAMGPEDAENQIHLVGWTLDPKKDPTNELRGTRELGQAVSEQLKAGGNAFVFSSRYQLTSQLAFYTQGRPRAYCINIDGRRYNQYDLWGGWEDLTGQDGLFVIGGSEPKARLFVEAMVQRGVFERGEYLVTVPVYRAKTLVKTYTISRLRGFSGKAPGPAIEKF